MPAGADQRHDMHSAEWSDIFNIHKARGTRCLDDMGKPIDAPKMRPERDPERVGPKGKP
jgi:hypothetical protein